MIPFFNTSIGKDAPKRVHGVLRSTFVNEGKVVREFEKALSRHLGLVRPVAVNSGTSALHLAVVLAGIKPSDEVILPAQTFVASGTVILQERAKPVFADIQYETGNIDPHSIEKKITSRTKAIMPVHWGGYPCDMAEINKIAKRHGLTVIEDAAHALGATYRGKPVGSLSDFTCFSFQAIKHVTTGDGGALCTKNSRLERAARSRRWFGIDRANSRPSILGVRIYDLKEVGFKYHLNDYAAALGLANLADFRKRLGRRRALARLYRAKLSGLPGITLFKEAPDRRSAYWIFGFHVQDRENFIRALHDRGVPTSVVDLGIDRYSIFGGARANLAAQRRFDATQIHIPFHDAINTETAYYIIQAIKKGW